MNEVSIVSPSPRRQADKAIEDGWKRQIQRVIAHVDLDAFYSQVEVKNDPVRLTGKPVVVMQYNPYGDLASHTPSDDRLFNDSNGSLIAVSYEARAYGVKRNMRGDEARKLCPELMQVQVPTAHGKADLTHYRSAGKQVTDILARLSICEKASIDECYLDITAEARKRANAFTGPLPLPVKPHEIHICSQEVLSAEQWWQRGEEDWTDEERLLACGAATVADLRAAVRKELGFSCSAGVANCKILAKLASGMHKPSQQTVVPASGVPGLLQDLPIPKLRQLGGKLGEEVMRVLNIKTVGQLAEVPKARLTQFFSDSQSCWLHELAHGIDADEVKQRTLPKSIGCGKTFHGKHTLYNIENVTKWVKELAAELEERVNVDTEENSREPKLVTIHASSSSVSYHGSQISRSGPLRRPTAEIIAEDAVALLKKWTSVTPRWSITGLSLVVSKFVAAPQGKSTMASFLASEGAKSPATQSQAPLKAVKPQQRTLNFGRLPAKASQPVTKPTNVSQTVAQSSISSMPWVSEALKQSSKARDKPEQAIKQDRQTDGEDIEIAVSDGEASAIRTKETDGQLGHQVQQRQDSDAIPESAAAELQARLQNPSSDCARDQTNTRGMASSLNTDTTALELTAHQSTVNEGQGNHTVDTDQAGRSGSGLLENPEFRGSDEFASEEQKPDRAETGASAFTTGQESVDPEVWNSLPKEIQRELRIEAMTKWRQKPAQPAIAAPSQALRPQKKQRTSKPIANFFRKKL